MRLANSADRELRGMGSAAAGSRGEKKQK